ncbi:hypothetical protein DENIS_4383 [Desulfonema ishimotonii]|uniref:Uncharacterized protein n=1 Tax=Desulfonema ishimotonii TaxID=45657 RepID=A0A401G2C8_9BACT|nr:hypothetical protein [Desulfonema ishimotonii]GBC63389.1 hypothetical protein DENIS_4383 [Desulfonema ishimotonii]
MASKIKKIIFLAILGYIIYFLLGHHLIFFGRNVEILQKQTLNLKNTFYSVGDRKEIEYKGLENMLANEDLREAGLGELLIEKDLISQKELEDAESKIDYGN